MSLLYIYYGVSFSPPRSLSVAGPGRPFQGGRCSVRGASLGRSRRGAPGALRGEALAVRDVRAVRAVGAVGASSFSSSSLVMTTSVVAEGGRGEGGSRGNAGHLGFSTRLSQVHQEGAVGGVCFQGAHVLFVFFLFFRHEGLL